MWVLRGRDSMVVECKTTVVISNTPRKGVSIQHNVIKFVRYLRQISGFLRVLRFYPLIKLTATIKLKYC